MPRQCHGMMILHITNLNQRGLKSCENISETKYLIRKSGLWHYVRCWVLVLQWLQGELEAMGGETRVGGMMTAKMMCGRQELECT